MLAISTSPSSVQYRTSSLRKTSVPLVSGAHRPSSLREVLAPYRQAAARQVGLARRAPRAFGRLHAGAAVDPRPATAALLSALPASMSLDPLSPVPARVLPQFERSCSCRSPSASRSRHRAPVRPMVSRCTARSGRRRQDRPQNCACGFVDSRSSFSRSAAGFFSMRLDDRFGLAAGRT